MPTISMFYGIIIRMYREVGGKHNTPHIHEEDLKANWQLLSEGQQFFRIDPLK